MFGNLNPFDLSGPEFLQLFAICLGAVSVITITYRSLQWITRNGVEPSRGKPLDVWELAYLRGREAVVAQTAVIDLSTAKLIEPDKNQTCLIATTLDPNKQLHPVPLAIFRASQSAGGVSAARLAKEIAFESQRIRDGLMDRGYLKSWLDRIAEVWPGYVGFGLLMALGLFRVGLGIYRDKPVGYLVLLLLATAGIGLALTYTRFLTSAGKRALQDSIAEIERQQAKRAPDGQAPGVPGGEQVPALATWAFAALGLASVQSMLDPGVAELIQKRMLPDGASGGAAGCGGGDGGGGGCGGGGCGGCGS